MAQPEPLHFDDPHEYSGRAYEVGSVTVDSGVGELWECTLGYTKESVFETARGADT